jgi:hypothetical protein
MKNIKILENDVRTTLIAGNLKNAEEYSIMKKRSSQIKKIFYIASLAGMGLFLNSCLAGYVTSEPSYVEYSRPPRPSETHVWINGNWYWNNQSQVYVQRTGYWEQPRQNQRYVDGYWKSTSKGKSWSPGHWQKDNSRGNRSRR